jgi:hypothetical protein
MANAFPKDGRYFDEITKSDETRPKVEIMGPHESLPEDLSNNYQCSRVSIASKIVFNFLFW